MLSDETLGGLTMRARKFGRKTALICGQRQFSYIELDDRVSSLAAVLSQRHVGPGDVVSIYGQVGWEWVIAYHAVLRTGATVNPINGLLTADEVGYILRDCSSAFLVTDASRMGMLEQGGIALPVKGAISFDEVEVLSTSGLELAPSVDRCEDVSTICYTSGTTGRPKGALLTHRAVLVNAGLTGLMHGRSAADVVLTALPLAHVYGNVVMNSCFLSGATLVLMPVFDAEGAIAAIEAHQATVFDAVPTMYFRMLDSPRARTASFRSLRMCAVGGQAMPVDKMEAVEATFGCPILELWGMSEIAGLGTTFPWVGPHTLGSIGVALPGVALRTIDSQSRQVTPTDQPGELQIRGPIVMIGYLNNREATAQCLDADGWLSTGDIARIDQQGNVFILDRMKDVILTSGNNVYPAEIERVISSIPGVVMVGVTGTTHPDKGEVAHAYVVRARGCELTDRDIISHCALYLAPYKLPKKISYVDDLPKTSSGKIMRRRLHLAITR